MTSQMKRHLILLSSVLLTLCGVLALAQDRGPAPQLERVRLGVNGATTRIVLDLTARPEATISPVSDPEIAIEVIVDKALIENLNLPPFALGVVDSVRWVDDRLVVALLTPALPVRNFILEPAGTQTYHRLVIDLEAVGDTSFAAAAGAAAEARTAALARNTAAREKPRVAAKDPDRAPEPTPDPPKATAKADATADPIIAALAKATDTRKLIVIDPGHGGKDPGAEGVTTGILEKDITLAAAVALQDVLVERGYRVMLTRDGDTFIDLNDRLRFARDLQAGLFLSLHADANPVPTARGASVYTLSADRSAKMANEVATAGNFRVFDHELGTESRDVSSILVDLAAADTQNHSDILAERLVDAMEGAIPMVNNTHRRMGLVVLLSPDVPAVLVELAFLSNAEDEANLRSSRWRRAAVDRIADGIDAYFASVPAPGAPGAPGAGAPAN